MMGAARQVWRRAAFLDRDGVINIDHGYVVRHEDFSFVPGVLAGARRLHEMGFALVVITNQSGIGRGLYDIRAFEKLTAWMKGEFMTAGAPLAGVYYCPHHPTEAVGEYRRECECRKPAPGLLLDAARSLDLNLGASVLFGDKETDLLAARAAGVPVRVLLGTDALSPPAAPSQVGLATALFRRLDEAVSNMSLLNAIDATEARNG
jgi:D-glycero-D-manno-heptose 1,7-bisphosphate phosphatase